ncbi:hypothetical protein [Geothermobacter hydrogeniphilus]|uniref:Uncharacterized protein n=1 Tax=Geothermobacter hydrogeniphilus TaxID=1969733 RepID=A0A1X0Y897_9BACT|nr:hypothetical protein [Geothermobacter hydrogeniphilus]ORJ61329.1 hypothetical protein B5V00_06770 [Geothermobacter hydrogeniphilus]
MRRLVFLALVALALGGCSAADLQRAETNTSLAGFASPLGEVVHTPIWIASTIANANTGSSDKEPQKVIEVKPDAEEQKRIEEYRRKNHLD